MYLVPLGLVLKSFGPGELLARAPVNLELLTWPAFFLSLIPVTLGNIVGGGVLVGAVYWFIYLRAGRRRA
jgi:formate transporter